MAALVLKMSVSLDGYVPPEDAASGGDARNVAAGRRTTRQAG
jgi:hypothetical protein